MSAHDAYTEDRDIQWFLDLKRRVVEAGGVLKKDRARYTIQSDRAAVFIIARPITSVDNRIPAKLRMHLKRYGTIPRDILLFNIEQVRIPYVKKHCNIINLGQNVFAVHVRFGFMEDPNAVRVLRDIYQDHVIEEKFRRCTIEVSEYEFIIEPNLPWRKRLQADLFRQLYLWSVPPYRFLGLTGEASAGLSKIIVPLRFGVRGVRIETPEFPLISRNDQIDPDTLQPDERRFIKL